MVRYGTFDSKSGRPKSSSGPVEDWRLLELRRGCNDPESDSPAIGNILATFSTTPWENADEEYSGLSWRHWRTRCMRSYRSLDVRLSDKLRFLSISVAVSADVKSLGSPSGRRLETTRTNAAEKR